MRKSSRRTLVLTRCCLAGSYHRMVVRLAVGSTDSSCFGEPKQVDGEELKPAACQRWLMHRRTQGMGTAEMELGEAGEELSGTVWGMTNSSTLEGG